MPAITTSPQYLLASNLSAVYIRTQDALGVWYDPTTIDGQPVGSSAFLGTNAVRVVGTPKFTPRGAGIIQRADVMTPWGGNQSSKTGGLGWDITLTTEFFWVLGQPYDINLLTSVSQLSALWKASPWAISEGAGGNDDTVFDVQQFFYADYKRTSVAFAAQPFSIVYEETGGKRFEAYDCVCVPKISWEYGQKVMIEWTVKGKWRPVTYYQTNTGPVYPEQYTPAVTQLPLVGYNCDLTCSPFFDNVNAVSKVTIDTGWAIADVADFRETYGFGLGFISLAASPSIELDVADFSEATEPDWTDAEANTIQTADLVLTLNVGTDSIAWTLINPQLVAFPTPGEANGYRTNSLKFQGIPTSDKPVMSINFTGAP